MRESETFISVDVEAAGPIPGKYSLLSIGACVVGDSAKNFYAELKPINFNSLPEALAVAGFDLHELDRTGLDPHEALEQFETWLRSVTLDQQPPIFVGYPLAFDWMFVAYYFQHFLGRNPFGYQGLDIKSYNMGRTGSRWDQSGLDHTGKPFVIDLTHNAREDAIAQAKVFEHMLRR